MKTCDLGVCGLNGNKKAWLDLNAGMHLHGDVGRENEGVTSIALC
jgi:hypothetical protein